MMKDMMMKNKIYIMPTQSLYIGYVWLHFEGEVSCNHTKPPVPTRNPRGWQKILTSSKGSVFNVYEKDFLRWCRLNFQPTMNLSYAKLCILGSLSLPLGLAACRVALA